MATYSSAELADELGVTRGRVTQIRKLMLDEAGKSVGVLKGASLVYTEDEAQQMRDFERREYNR
jgi:hypothetical protein